VADSEDFSNAVSRGAIDKLIDAEAAVEQMRRAQDPGQYRRAFEYCCTAIQSARYRLEADTVKVVRRRQRRYLRQDFTNWWKQITKYVDSDELLSWVETARHDFGHVGPSALTSAYMADYVDGRDFDWPPGAQLGIGIEGAIWIIDAGTAREKVFPAIPRPGTRTATGAHQAEFRPVNPPRSHRGVQLPTERPSDMCQLAIDYWRSLVEEAMARWGSALSPARESDTEGPSPPNEDQPRSAQ
jgi:hypothetical protein